MAFPTATEQYMLELINKARSDPNAEAARLGIDLNKDLTPGTINGNAKAPLAFSTFLNVSADKHSVSMINDNYFSHTGSDGTSPTNRMFAAGWTSSNGGYSTGENIAGAFGSIYGYNAFTMGVHHDGLFKSSGHRKNLMSETFSEIGIGQFVGAYSDAQISVNTASMVTQNFAHGGRTFLTGVVINDADGDNFYDIGEGQGAVSVKAVGANGTFSTMTWDAGGYSLQVQAGTYELEFSGGGLNGTIKKTVTVGAANVKVDARTAEAVVDGNKTINGNASSEVLLGGEGNDTITGAGGNDTINGGAGVDTAKYAGAATQFSLTITKGAATTVQDRKGTEGVDSLTGIENIDFLTGTKDVNLDALDGVVNVSAADLTVFIEMYIAYFNRAPDAEGLFYWGTRLSEGMQLSQIAKSFFVQPETVALYPDPNDTTGFVTAVYNNFLGRAPDTSGFNYWVSELNSGSVSRDVFMLAIINGAKAATGNPNDVDYITGKAKIGTYFSVIKGMGDKGNAKSAMALYDGSDAGLAAAKNAVDAQYTAALDPNSGELLINLVGVMDDPFTI
ncbi:DUF4214 domain-containing protein [Maritalea porphyrae]|uniref:DUF4214 domain-containing protein n=1 Tax=Maritalea porphyrae TaxID=880732 RepID=UPI0022AFAA98|nr:DUF4214 domain-containing protein [Maritalea porphyrae]MCZ4273485.1 DUF4214 domain-containing protein [Maritalea porphyrae]